MARTLWKRCGIELPNDKLRKYFIKKFEVLMKTEDDLGFSLKHVEYFI